MNITLTRVCVGTILFTAFGAFQAPAARTLNHFINLGRVETGSIEAQGSHTSGGEG